MDEIKEVPLSEVLLSLSPGFWIMMVSCLVILSLIVALSIQVNLYGEPKWKIFKFIERWFH